MKLFRKILIILLIAFVVISSILFIIGFSYYSKALKEKPLISRVEEVTNDEHFVSFDELPENYINAVIAVEDHRYYDHGAIDMIGIARAIWVNIKNGELQEGGSTITQQVAKNLVFSQEETLKRIRLAIMNDKNMKLGQEEYAIKSDHLGLLYKIATQLNPEGTEEEILEMMRSLFDLETSLEKLKLENLEDASELIVRYKDSIKLSRRKEV